MCGKDATRDETEISIADSFYQPTSSGVHPLSQWCNPPISDFPSFRNISVWENLSNFSSKKYVSSTKISYDLLLVIHSELFIPPFSLKRYIPLISQNFYSPIYFGKFSSDFVWIYVFLHTLRVLRFPLLWPWCIVCIIQCTTGLVLGSIGHDWPYFSRSI